MTASTNNFMANRNSTPDISRQGSLQLPNSRAPGTPTSMRTSADMSGYVSSPLSGRSSANRPSSEVYSSQVRQSVANEEAMDKAAQQWLADIDQYETTLEEMAAATLDQEFKDELSAIEQWFKVLSEPERTAALYQLLQQTTQLQIRFFIQVLQEMAKSNPVPGVQNALTDKEAHRASDATGKLSTAGDRSSLARPTQAGSAKRNSGLDASTINAMFPHAADAIAKKKAEYTEQTGIQPVSNRNSTAQPDRNSLAAPIISTTPASNEKPTSPWVERRTSAAGQIPAQPPMGQFAQPPQSAGLRAPLTGGLPPSPAAHLRATELTAPVNEMPILSPYNLTGSWASMTNTPMVPNFNLHPAQADLIANATASKLAALSTVNNRVMLDDPRKYRRARSNDGGSASNIGMNTGMATNVLVVNEAGQLVNSGQLNASQLAALQNQNNFRARPHSPFGALSSGGLTSMSFSSPQTNGFLSAYDSSAGLPTAMTGLSLGGFGLPEGYISDHSDMNRGRSPRGRRGTSKAPEDPTDLALLNDIPAWLRMLRLHKYTDNLKDVPWMELINLDEQGLDEKGVNALGARRKMLKAFEQVKEAQAKGDLPSPTKTS